MKKIFEKFIKKNNFINFLPFFGFYFNMIYFKDGAINIFSTYKWFTCMDEILLCFSYPRQDTTFNNVINYYLIRDI